MLERNIAKLIKKIRKNDQVLDIGGWDIPFGRANFVVDIHPYETRGFHGKQGKKEFFSKKTWIIHDLSSRKKLPFTDKQFDFIICSHVLEDLRDPVWLCQEIMRVGKKGYIETPSNVIELTKGVANKKYAGYYHHRWLVEIKDNQIFFRFKPHLVHNNWKYHFPKRFLKKIKKSETVSCMFWNHKFRATEIIQISRDKVQEYLEDLIKSKNVYPKFYYLVDKIKCKLSDLVIKNKRRLFPNRYYHRYMDTPNIVSK